MLDLDGDITWETFRAAMQYAETAKGSMVKQALRLWSAGRIIERPWRMCGSDTLGCEPVDPVKYPGCPYTEIIPVPPIMAAHLDQVVIQGVLVPVRNELLEQLQESVENPKPESWFEIYLTIFILLSTVETTSAHSAKFARNFGFPVS